MRSLSALLVAVTACGGAGRPAPAVPAPGDPVPAEPAPAEPAPAPPPAPKNEPVAIREPEPPPLPPAPWAAAPAAGVPRVYRDEWKKADNRATCPILVITDAGPEGAGAKPRRANFAGGWAVAYDKKGLPGTAPTGADCDTCGRGAFGVAGAGVSKEGGPEWPNELRWADGSHAGYGPEGGGGRKALAFLSVEGAGCLYNVWSALGEDHLVVLLQGLRRAP